MATTSKSANKSTKGTTTGAYNSPFTERLRDLLEQRNTTKQALGDYLSVSQQAVSLYASGNSQPTLDKLIKIAEYFNVSADYLLGLSDISSKNIEAQAIHKFTGLQEQAIEVLGLYAKTAANNYDWAKHFNDFGENGEPLIQTTTELELKALNHIIANCNALLTHIGLYLFGEFTGLEKVKVEGINIGIDKPGEFMRNAILTTISTTLENYRKKLLDNGGDLPLTLVLEKTKEDKRERFVKQRVEFLEGMRGRTLTEAEIQEQRELFDKSTQPKTEKELEREQALIEFTEQSVKSGEAINLTAEELSAELDKIIAKKKKRGG
jgi:transcriptional regulator with XRE-family HTH domain